MHMRRSRGFRPAGDHLGDRCLLSGYTPAQITAAYGLNAISFTSTSGTAVAGDGAGQTIAIVDIYHDPGLQASIDGFDAQFGLPAITLDVINQAGSQIDDSWASEEALDVEWAHAIAPAAAIDVVEAAPGSTAQQGFNDLMTGVQTASQLPGVSVVSMSWGFAEYSGELGYDSNFTTPGITYIAAGGDFGQVTWPSSSPNVLAVGGTTLELSASGGYGSEVGWTDTGGGLSADESEPTYQAAVQSTGDRSTPDVSFDADPDTGVAIYFVPPEDPTGPGEWGVIGGTSAGAPAWAGLIAIADQGRVLGGLSTLTGATQTIPDLYALPSSDFNAVPLTSDGGASNSAIDTSLYNTQAGLGSPVGEPLVAALAGSTATSATPTSTPTPTTTPTAPPTGLPPPRPIVILAPSPTPTPTGLPTPVVLGPTSTTPLPTPTPATTPPPAAPPTPAPTPAATPHATSRHKHHAPVKKPPAHRQVVHRARSSGQASAPKKTHADFEDRRDV